MWQEKTILGCFTSYDAEYMAIIYFTAVILNVLGMDSPTPSVMLSANWKFVPLAHKVVWKKCRRRGYFREHLNSSFVLNEMGGGGGNKQKTCSVPF